MTKKPQLRFFTRRALFAGLTWIAGVGFFSGVHAQGTDVDLQGTVVDPQGKGIAGATVGILNSSLSANTDAQGGFSLKGTLTLGIIRKASLPGGMRLRFSEGLLTWENPTGRPARLDWIATDGRQRILAQGNGRAGTAGKTIDLDRLEGGTPGIHWLRVTTESGVSTFRFVKQAGDSHGRLLSGIVSGSSTKPSGNGAALAKSSRLETTVAREAAASFIIEVSATGYLGKRFPQGESVKTGVTLDILPVAATLKERIRDFIGPNRDLRVAFLEKEAGVSRKFFLNYVDLAEMANDTMPVHSFPDSHGPDNSPYGAFGPSWSPDGRTLAYETGFENLTTPISRIYLQPLQGARKDGPAYPSTNPRWWTNGTDTSLVWCTSGGQSGWADTNSSTRRQKVSGGSLTGAFEVLARGSYNGGLSPDGHYLATGYPYGVMLDRDSEVRHFFHVYPGHPPAKDGSPTDSLQVCNASVSQDPAHPSRMLFLDFGVLEEPTYANIVTPKIYAQHRMILIGDYASDAAGRIVDFVDTPAAELALGKTWDDPEWTNLPGFAVATTRDPNGDKSNPSEPQSTQPDIYLIKLDTKESIKVFTGANQTLPVAWIGASD
jgi:hypothetical protein